MPHLWSPLTKNRRKRLYFAPYCGDETITFYDRACSSDVTGGIPSGVPRHGVFHASHCLFGAGCACSASRYGILPWRRVNMASGASSVFTALVIASGFRTSRGKTLSPGMVSSKISSARSNASSSEGKTFSSPTVRRIPTRWSVLWTGFRTAANSTRQPFRRRSRNSSNAWIPVMSMADMLCRYIMNTLGGVSIAFSVDWNRSATPKNSGPLMAKNLHTVGYIVFVRDRNFVPGCLVLAGNAGMETR